MVYEQEMDSFLLKKHIAEFARGNVLDMGTGSGILAKEAQKYAKTVLAADIDPEAVEAARKAGIDAVQSDLFENISGKFDLIIFNPPYLPEDEGLHDPALYGGKLGYETIVRFLEQAKGHLKEKGRILLLFSSFTGKGHVEASIAENGFIFTELEKAHMFFEDLYVYLIEPFS